MTSPMAACLLLVASSAWILRNACVCLLAPTFASNCAEGGHLGTTAVFPALGCSGIRASLIVVGSYVDTWQLIVFRWLLQLGCRSNWRRQETARVSAADNYHRSADARPRSVSARWVVNFGNTLIMRQVSCFNWRDESIIWKVASPVKYLLQEREIWWGLAVVDYTECKDFA
jgi:hypothetical protein